MKGYIYIIESPNNKIYIGQTINFNKRVRDYKNNSFYKQPILWNDSKKYNYNPSDFMRIIEEIEYDSNLVNGESLLDLREMFWIEFYKSYYYINPQGLNLTKGGRTRKGYITSEETKKKQRAAKLDKPGNRKNKKHTVETINKLSQYRGENHWNFGGSVSEETKKKISESQKGEKHWNFGGSITNEHKNKISKKLKGKKISELAKIKFDQYNDNRKRSVTIDNILYDSINEAARELNLIPQTVLNRCKNIKFPNYKFFDNSESDSK
jgi:group I intron endonuclease